MTGRDEEFLALLRSTFKVEADEHMQTISSGLLDIEKNDGGDIRSSIERVFRAVHTLKGAARAVDFKEIEGFCQLLEDVFASWKRGDSAPTEETLDALHRALDTMTSTLSAPAHVSRHPELTSLRRTLQQAEAIPQHQGPLPEAPRDQPAKNVPSEQPAAFPSVTAERAEPSETVRVSVKALEAQLLQAEEILAVKLTTAQRASDLRELAQRFEPWRKAYAHVEADARELRRQGVASPVLIRVLDFFDWTLDTLKTIEQRASSLSDLADRDRDVLGRLLDELLDESKKLLLLPFATITTSFPKLVRDLTRDQGKEADLTIHGDDVKIDKRILEEIKDPIVHLLRNSIDHGVEIPDERARQGKPRRASIVISVSQTTANEVQVVLSDDGAGIDSAKVRESAIRHGAINADDAARISDSEAQQLVFRSDVTTSPIITEVSGRGLGLAIVQEKAEKLGGEARVESKPREGTTFRMTLPATRATFRGILVEARGSLMVVPTTEVERVGRARAEDIRTVRGRETIVFHGRTVPLVRLADALDLPSRHDGVPPANFPVMILGSGDQQVAYAIDSVVDEQEVLVKPLRTPLCRVRNVAAATVLGSGHVAPILNVSDLLKSARRASRVTPGVLANETAAVAARKILVAEDSITSRMLLKSILETAGYNVKTAIDGMEAFALLRVERFDLVVSDVEMPRLNGFDLTARIRADRKLSELPVVLVTALETREDRERGIDAGANAYIVKGSFDQSNLLEAVRRLI